MDSAGIAAELGLDQWVCKGDGIGGLIKVRVADFRVTEDGATPALDPKGRFTVARITLENWKTNRFVNRLAKSLKISRKRIWFSGTKDKRAITTQLFVIDAPMKRVSEVCNSRYWAAAIKNFQWVLILITDSVLLFVVVPTKMVHL